MIGIHHRPGPLPLSFAAFVAVAFLGISYYVTTAVSGTIAVATTAGVDTSCHVITPGIQMDLGGYAPPYSVHTPTTQPLLAVRCGSAGRGSFVAGTPGSATTFVYEFGYHLVGGAWELIRFTGAEKAGPWFVGSASASLENMASGADGQVLAYVCEYAHGRWYCGCTSSACTASQWQIQKYRYIVPSSDAPPIVAEITPSLIQNGTVVTIHGSGFDPHDNTVWTPYGVFSGIPSPDTQTLTFVFKTNAFERVALPHEDDPIWDVPLPGEQEVTYGTWEPVTNPVDDMDLGIAVDDTEPGGFEAAPWLRDPGTAPASFLISVPVIVETKGGTSSQQLMQVDVMKDHD